MAVVQLRQRRLERGWTLDDVVDQLHRLAHGMGEPVPGVDRQTVSRWERGTHRPRAYYVRLLSTLYRASPLELGLVDQAEQHTRVQRLSTRWGTVVGRVWFPWVVASYGPYRPEHIVSHYDPEEPNYPDAIEESFRLVQEDIAARERRGEEVPYDSDDWKLTSFHVSSRVGSLEEPRLVLHFGPTTYYRMLATDQRLDVPLTVGGRTYTLRERYAAEVDLRVAQVPELATHWGVGLSVITADGLLLVSERGNTAVDPHVYFPAVAEGATRAMDATADGAPDHFSVASRGVHEELGVDLAEQELTWLSFGANSYLCEYGLIGRVDTRCSLAEIESRRSLGAAKDSWETKRLHPLNFDPESVARFCSEPGRRFSAFALVALVHTLMNEFGAARTAAAFADARVAVTQHLPPWLEALDDSVP